MIALKRLLVATILAVIAAKIFSIWLEEFDVSNEQMFSLFQIFDWRYLPPFLTLLIAYVALSSWRWSLIELALSGLRPNFRLAMITGLFALGVGVVLPSPLANVACRSLSNRLVGTSAIRGAISGGLDQVSDLLIFSFVAVPAILAFIIRDISVYLIGAPVALLSGGIFVFFIPSFLGFGAVKARIPGQAYPLLMDRRLLAQIYAISVFRVINLTLLNLAIHLATGTASVGAVLVSVPIVAIAIAAFMLPGGIGISEWSFSAVFAALGVASGDIVIFVLANRVVFTGLSLALLLATLASAALRIAPSLTVKLKRR